MSDAAEMEQARRLFRRFQYRDPRGAELIEIGLPQKPPVALLVGKAVAIAYKAIGDGKDYYHEFESTLPQLYVSADGKQAYFVGGSYTFTDRGFIK